MGSYVYKVTAEKVKLSNGEKANVATYAYKPVRDFLDGDINHKMHFESGCVTHDRMAKAGKRSPWVVMNDLVLKFPAPVGSFDDDPAVEKYLVEGVTIK